MFHQFGEDIKEWESIIKKSAANLANYRDHVLDGFIYFQLDSLCRSLQKKEIDIHYLNWFLYTDGTWLNILKGIHLFQ